MTRDPSKSQVNITGQCSKCINILVKCEEAFNTFKISDSAKTTLFACWNNFLTRSFQDADWHLHLSSVNRAIDLCFFLITTIISAGCLSIMRIVLHCPRLFLKCINLS